MKRTLICLCLMNLCLLILVSCQGDQKREARDQSQSSEAKADVNALPDGEVKYTVPAGWIQQHPSTSMRRDQFSLPGVDGADAAELAVFFFPGEGGTVDANLKRWYNQFKQPDGGATKDKVELRELNIKGLPVTTAYVTGTYLKTRSPMMMSGPVDELPDYALLAAIAETANGNWFFKTTGPKQTIDHWRPSFEEFVHSFHPE